ncbi:MAG TPA: N,N-dimethylformamidase beta subunit family domain-containing protein [Acidimicrobiales bacterium]|nr:N,N-dimethylformamidase beta subunit family domain-containing protein [Acidimicrobiales bacterium]
MPSGRGYSRARSRARTRAFAGAVSVAALAAVVVALLVVTGPSGGGAKPAGARLTSTTVKTAARSSRGAAPLSTTTRPHSSPRRTFLGPYGIESAAIIAENNRPGTTSWEISAASSPGYIEGFANVTYAQPGAKVRLYVSTTAPSYRVIAYRMGWYHGKGGREVWQSGSLPGHVQPPCPVAPVTNMVSCTNWSFSTTVVIGGSWAQGDYLFKLVGSGGQQSYIILTVWDPAIHGAYLVMTRSLTEQAWNPYGGYDLYQGEGPCPPGSSTYPPCNRARVVSFDRPYGWGHGAADFLDNEYPFVQWAERHGLDVSYATDITVSEHPGLLLTHKALLSLDHDEVWTNSERIAALTAAASGVNMVFFGAAPVLRHARLQPSAFGPDREEVDYRDSAEDPLDGKVSPYQVTGNTWSSPPTDWDEEMFVGEMYSGYVLPGAPSAALAPYDASSWLFAGTGLRKGSTVPDVIASDIDHLDPDGPMPANLQVLAHSPVLLAHVYTNQGQWGGYTYSDMTYYTAKEGSGVFDSGTVNWLTALVTCTAQACPATALGRITGNLLSAFGRGPAGRLHPSVANWQSVTPPGS